MSTRNRFGPVLAVFVAFLLALAGCGGSSDGDGGAGPQVPPVPPQQLVFDSATMVEAGVISVDVVELFPDFTNVLLTVIEPLSGAALRAPAQRVAAAVIPLGDLGLCTNAGSSELTWDDVDDSLALSVGDTATVVFADCSLEVTNEVLSGTLTMTLTAVELPARVEGRLTSPGLVLTDLLPGGGSETLTVDFGLQIIRTLADVTLVYGAPAAADVIRFADETGASVQFGCFDVTHVIDLPQPPIPEFTLAPRGIVNANGLIMQLGSYQTATMDVPLAFAGLIPTSGTITLFNFDGRPTGPCTAVGSTGTTPAAVSAERITATGGGDVHIETFDDVDLTPPPADEVFMTWMELVAG